ncbi:Zinc finger BED domain containing protein 1 [Dissostichus eleginoides]|uniref:Zinc finger BED domain containing protein 1 n=1 Tax=Dissostichus eleginoides TaxID=100907 RepID=A0AAD9BJ87_DISEL|nr:Zinc finger BED domain containing protein 1 [Dissostichus eleginoides]
MDGESDSDVEELVPKNNSTSVVWNYFGFYTTDTDQTNVICKICKKENVKATDGNTSGLRDHLKRKHQKEYAEFGLLMKRLANGGKT